MHLDTKTESSVVQTLPDLPSVQPQRGHLCAGPSCETLVLRPSRFCDGCFADAAKDLARKIEAQLIARGFEPGDETMRNAIRYEASFQQLRWYELSSLLGELRPSEAVYLRSLTESACLLVSMGGVAALANLPGTRRLDAREGKLDFRALPQAKQTEPVRPWHGEVLQMERRYQTYVAAVLSIMLLALVLAVRA